MMQVAPEQVGVGFVITAFAGVIPAVIPTRSGAIKEVQTSKNLNFEVSRAAGEVFVCVILAIRPLLAYKISGCQTLILAKSRVKVHWTRAYGPLYDLAKETQMKAWAQGLVVTVNPLKSTPPPRELLTNIGPELAPAGIVPVTEVEVRPVIFVRFSKPILTVSTPSKPVPVIVTSVPTGPDDGEIPEIFGFATALVLQAFDVAIAIWVGVVETGAVGAATKT
jgi:hypothetical protein